MITTLQSNFERSATESEISKQHPYRIQAISNQLDTSRGLRVNHKDIDRRPDTHRRNSDALLGFKQPPLAGELVPGIEQESVDLSLQIGRHKPSTCRHNGHFFRHF